MFIIDAFLSTTRIFSPLLAMILIGYANTYIVRYYSGRVSATYKKIIYTVGTPVHELSHLLLAAVSGQQIVDVKFLDLNNNDGSTGYTSFYINGESLFSIIMVPFVATAPVLLSCLAFWIPAYMVTGIAEPYPALVEFATNYWFVPVAIFLLAVAPLSCLSVQDLRMALFFTGYLFAFTFIVLLIVGLFGGNVSFGHAVLGLAVYPLIVPIFSIITWSIFDALS